MIFYKVRIIFEIKKIFIAIFIFSGFKNNIKLYKDKGFKGTYVNHRALSSLHAGSLYITITVPLSPPSIRYGVLCTIQLNLKYLWLVEVHS